MKYKFIDQPQQTVEYYTLHALEHGCAQACHAEHYLGKLGKHFTRRQISAALQRLKRAGIVRNDGKWELSQAAEPGLLAGLDV